MPNSALEVAQGVDKLIAQLKDPGSNPTGSTQLWLFLFFKLLKSLDQLNLFKNFRIFPDWTQKFLS